MMQLKTIVKDFKLAKTILFREPYKCIVQVTNRCNMQCSFCDFWPNGVPPHQELNLKDYENLAHELSQLGCFIISIEGGEPLIRPDIQKIVKIFSERHVPILFTNGWYVDEAMAKNLFEAGLAQIGVSIDFPDAGRHDTKRRLKGGFDRAIRAVELLRAVAPQGEKQVYVMSVLMKDNQHDLEELLKMSASLKVGHTFTLLSVKGFRRKTTDALPDIPLSHTLKQLYAAYPHFKAFQKYLEWVDPYLNGNPNLPACRAGIQSFNIDHRGNVAPCIEKIDQSFGNIRTRPISQILKQMHDLEEVKHCQDCFTLCRGFSQCLDQGGDLRSWKDLGMRMRTF